MKLFKYDPSVGYIPADNEEVVSEARSHLNRKFRRGATVSSPDSTRRYLHMNLVDRHNETFAAIWLDNRHRVIEYEELFFGTIDGASVYPRTVVQKAMGHNAAAAIFAHNHPSGIAEPSQADLRITQRLKDALALVDVRVLDHLVIGEGVTSLAEKGLL